MTKQERFIALVAPWAIQASRMTGGIVPPSLSIAQAALETGWGKTVDERNIYLGVKGKTGALLTTHENKDLDGDGVVEPHERVKIKARFRSYPSGLACFMDHATLLTTDSRYLEARQASPDSIAMAYALEAAPYATDPEYAKNLESIIRKYKLKRFDAAVKQPAKPAEAESVAGPEPEPVPQAHPVTGKANVKPQESGHSTQRTWLSR